MVQNMHIIIFIISILITLILIRYGDSHISSSYVLMLVIINISNLGYLELSNAKTLEGALLANKISYLGGCFLPCFIIECICEVCKQKIPKWIRIVSLGLSGMAYCLVCTVGHFPIYYKDVALTFENGNTYLLKTYGPLHNLYLILLCAYFLVAFAIIIYSFFRQSEVSYKSTVILFGMMVFSSTLYMLGSRLEIKEQIIPLIYLIDGTTILLLLFRIRMYDISTVISTTVNEANEYGFIVFDSNKNYIGSNQRAKTLFKELIPLKIDCQTWKNMSSPLLAIVNEKMSALDVGKNIDAAQITCGNLEIKCTVKQIVRKNIGRIIGYYAELLDDTEQCKYVELLNNYNVKLEADVAEKVSHIQKIQDDIILSMADIVENRDSNTGGHIRRTSEGVNILVQQMMQMERYQNINRSFFECVIKAAPLHDFGKIAIEDSILRKPGRFTDEEFEKMKEHSNKGANIVGQILNNVNDDEFLKIAVNIANYHHEKWNGSGYPQRLKGEEIPLEARIMALADVFDALVSKRCYKSQYSYDEAFRIIEESLGSHFDPEIGEAFMKCRPKLEAFYNGIQEKDTVA